MTIMRLGKRGLVLVKYGIHHMEILKTKNDQTISLLSGKDLV